MEIIANKMKISKRLLAIAKMVPPNLPCADIGSDHGLLVKYLLDNQIVPFSYASDNKIGPYNRLKENLASYISSNKVKVDLIDGIKNLPENCLTLIIAGMGGELIKEILVKDFSKLSNVKYILLAPHGKEKELRQFLSKKNYKIIDENIIFEDHFYEIILFKKVDEEIIYSSLELEYGPINLLKKDENFKKKYQERISFNKNLLANYSLSPSRKKEIEQIVNSDEEILKELS